MSTPAKKTPAKKKPASAVKKPAAKKPAASESPKATASTSASPKPTFAKSEDLVAGYAAPSTPVAPVAKKKSLLARLFGR